MTEFHVFVKLLNGVCYISSTTGQSIELWPGSEAHLKFSSYEKKKEKK